MVLFGFDIFGYLLSSCTSLIMYKTPFESPGEVVYMFYFDLEAFDPWLILKDKEASQISLIY